jgi:hypothetical protein
VGAPGRLCRFEANGQLFRTARKAVREEVRGIPNPTEALLAAARLGEHQAMKAQIAALEARCQKLSDALEATTFRLAKSEGEARDRAVLATQLDAAVQRLTDALTQKASAGRAADPALKRTLAQVNALREAVHRRRTRKGLPQPRPKARRQSTPSAPRPKGSRTRGTGPAAACVKSIRPRSHTRSVNRLDRID